MNRETKIMFGITVGIVAVLVALFVAFGRSSSTTSSGNGQLVRSDSHRLGVGAVQVVEFGDYQCPACGAAYPITKQVLATYGDKITFIFRNYPLPMHPNAPMAAEAAEAAAAQGKFWEMHDKLYETQSVWSGLSNPLAVFSGYAQGLGLDVAKFKGDVQGNAAANLISQDEADANAYNIQGTPTFYVNGKVASDYAFATLKSMIETALK